MNGTELKSKRLEWDMKQTEFAEILSMSCHTAVSHMENGRWKVPLRVERFIKLIDHLREYYPLSWKEKIKELYDGKETEQ